MDSAFALYLAAAAFLFVSHAVPSAPGLRPVLIERLGRRLYMTLYALLSIVALAAFVWTYRLVSPDFWVFVPPVWAAHLAVAAMPVAFVLVIARLTSPFGSLAEPKPAQGIYRICRFPGSSGLLLWACLHLLATGDGRRFILFATMAVIAGYALAKNARLLDRADSEAARRFRRETSLLPFAAILAGRQRLALGESAWRVLLGLVLYVAMLALHPLVFGVDPLYWWG